MLYRFRNVRFCVYRNKMNFGFGANALLRCDDDATGYHQCTRFATLVFAISLNIFKLFLTLCIRYKPEQPEHVWNLNVQKYLCAILYANLNGIMAETLTGYSGIFSEYNIIFWEPCIDIEWYWNRCIL